MTDQEVTVYTKERATTASLQTVYGTSPIAPSDCYAVDLCFKNVLHHE